MERSILVYTKAACMSKEAENKCNAGSHCQKAAWELTEVSMRLFVLSGETEVSDEAMV